MTGRRLPCTARGRALPRGGPETVTWPPALRGRSPLLTLALLGWLGGGLLATAVALVTDTPDDLTYGLTNLAVACAGLLLLAATGLRGTSRRASRSQSLADEPLADGPLADGPVPVPVPVPVQETPDHDDRRAPALR